jgi:integrase
MQNETSMRRRRRGEGGIEESKKRGMYRGHYRDAGGVHVRLPWCLSRNDAEQQLQAALEMMAASGQLSGGGVTLRSWGDDFLDKREAEGHRAIEDDRSRWKHVLAADFIDWPTGSITRRDVKRWMVRMNSIKTHGRGNPSKRKAARKPTKPLSWQTKTHALNLLRQAFDVAIEDEIVNEDFENPCIGLKFKKPPTTEVPTNFFTRPEIERLQAVAPPHVRPLLEFAIATGLRQGEMRALRDADVHLDAETPFITVRYGSPPMKPTKSGHVREVPLLPMAVRALKDWQEIRKTWCTNNFKELTFPAQRGGYRSEGKFLGRANQNDWKKLLRAAKIERHLVWHDLRHTCATALLGGYFGRKWRLEEIQQLLGHADIQTTQRYAHALKQTLTEAARETWGDIGGGNSSDAA